MFLNNIKTLSTYWIILIFHFMNLYKMKNVNTKPTTDNLVPYLVNLVITSTNFSALLAR